MANSTVQHIRRIPEIDLRQMALDFLEACKRQGVVPAKCTGGFTLYMNQGGLIGTGLDVKNPL